MPITDEQARLILAQQEEILLTLSEMKNILDKGERNNTEVKTMLEDMNGKSKSFNSGIRG